MLRTLALAAPAALALSLAPVAALAVPQEPTPQQKPQELPPPTLADARALLDKKDFKAAADAYARIFAADRQNAQAIFMQGYALHLAGDLKAAHDVHLAAAEFPAVRAMALYNHACVHALWKDTDIALQSLREAIDAGYSDVANMQGDTDLDSLRSDPRFAALLAELQPAPTRDELQANRWFDFYEGTWQVFRGTTLEHTLTVTPAFAGQGWRMSTTDPKSGAEVASSLFVFDQRDGVWRQNWASATGQVVTMAGGPLNGSALAMRVERDSSNAAQNGRAVFRGLPASGPVSEFEYAWQTTRDDGQTWADVATRRFVRQP